MTDRKFDRIADAFMAPGPVVLPDRVLDAAFEEVHRTRQRRALWRAPWRFLPMNTFMKVAVAAVAVIAIGALGLTFLDPGQGGIGGAPNTAPSPTAAPAATPTPVPVPTAPPLTGQFTSPSHGYSIAVPETWSTRPATASWTTEYVDYFSGSGDILEGENGAGFVAVASQPLGDRTPAGFEADAWQIVTRDEPAFAGCAASAEPITIDGATGVYACDYVFVTRGGRGYWIRDFLGDDPPWDQVYDPAFFESMLATMKLLPEDAVDGVASTEPALSGQFTSERHGYSISYPETWVTRPATTAWTSGTVDYFNDGADLLMPGNPGTPFVALAAQQLGDRTSAEWEADVWQMLTADDPGVAECRSTATPITIDGASGVRGCDTVLVTDGGRGYVVMFWIASETPAAAVADDRALYESILATMKLQPENAVDGP